MLIKILDKKIKCDLNFSLSKRFTKDNLPDFYTSEFTRKIKID